MPDTTDKNSDLTDEQLAELPEWAKEKLKKVNREAASLRARLRETEEERDGFKGQLEEKQRKDESETDKLKRQVSELEKKAAKADQGSIEVLKLRVALRKGLSETQAKRLVGTNEAELESDADDLVESFGGKGKASDDADETPTPRRQPKRLQNAGDPEPDSGPEINVDKALELIPRL